MSIARDRHDGCLPLLRRGTAQCSFAGCPCMCSDLIEVLSALSSRHDAVSLFLNVQPPNDELATLRIPPPFVQCLPPSYYRRRLVRWGLDIKAWSHNDDVCSSGYLARSRSGEACAGSCSLPQSPSNRQHPDLHKLDASVGRIRGYVNEVCGSVQRHRRYCSYCKEVRYRELL
jgi:hypothetical protein